MSFGEKNLLGNSAVIVTCVEIWSHIFCVYHQKFFFLKKLPSNYCCCISLFSKTDAMDASDIEPWNRLPFPVQDWRITFPMVRDCIYCVINSLFRHKNCNASNFSNWTAVLDVVSLSWWCCCHRCCESSEALEGGKHLCPILGHGVFVLIAWNSPNAWLLQRTQQPGETAGRCLLQQPHLI